MNGSRDTGEPKAVAVRRARVAVVLILLTDVAFVGIGALVGQQTSLGAIGGALVGLVGIALVIGCVWLLLGAWALRKDLRTSREPYSRDSD